MTTRVPCNPSGRRRLAVLLVLAWSLAALALALAPATAPAATADADVRMREGVLFGRVAFTAAPGETNRLSVALRPSGVVFRDPHNPVRARGDCRQVDRHAALCPRTEETPSASLGDRDDTATDGRGGIEIRGGRGDDRLRAAALGGSLLLGGRGDDLLRGGRARDELTGGPGRDKLFGGSGDDVLADGETDAQAARDVLVGGSSRDTSGPDRGDVLSYATRRRALRIDLGRRRTSTEDALRGFESVVGGRGDDRLAGDGDDNHLEGGRGDDALRGRDGDDIPFGGAGNDRLRGEGGEDVLWGDAGRDALSGGGGADLLIALEERGPREADDLDCGRARGDFARTDARDTLAPSCEEVVAFSNGLSVEPLPALRAASADFRLTCLGGNLGGCQGTISLTGPDGTRLGSARFDVASDVEDAVVAVPLDPAARERLRRGAMVQVDLVPDLPSSFEEPGGYRAFMRADGGGVR